nr:hypothetical protein [Tanacetum cinerariifolium]
AIRDALHLDDAEGVDCLPNEEIFTELARMGYKKPTTKLTFYKAFFSSQWKFLIHIILQSISAKRTSGNEFSSAMASAVICLSTGDLSTHSTEYISPALTQKVFANMRRVGKGCSGVETPLFKGMIAAREPENQGNAEEHGDEEEHGTDNVAAEEPLTAVDDVQSLPPQQQSPPPAQPHGAYFPISLLQEALDACVALTRRVEQLEHDKVAQDLEILKLKTRVKKLERANKVKTVKLRRLRKVGTSQRIESSDDTLMEDVSNQRREFNRAEDVMKETEEVREYTADTQVEGRQLISITLIWIMLQNETVSAAAVIPFAIPETISAAAIPTVTAPSIKVAAPVKAAVSSTRRKRGVVIRDPEEEYINMDHAAKVLSMQEDESEVHEAVEVVTTAKLITEVVDAVISVAAIIPSAVPETISAAAILTVTAPSIKVAAPVKAVVKLQEEFNQDIDWEAAIDHVKQRAKEEPFIQRYQVMKKRPQTEAQARRNMMMYLKNTAGFTLDFFRGMSYDDIRLIFEAKFNANLEFLLMSKEHIEEEKSRAIATINKTLAQKAAKRRKLIEEAKEAESIKQHLQIVPNEDDDVFTEATPLARKLYASFITMLKIFNREDLETLWRIVKERFFTSKANNFLDEYLLTALKTMFKRPDGQDNVWRNQSTVHGQALVKSWKLLTSCGVHIISFNTTQIILLVERRYPLTKFTLEQMLNVVRLQVEEESEMSLELIRFTRKQLQEAQHN